MFRFSRSTLGKTFLTLQLPALLLLGSCAEPKTLPIRIISGTTMGTRFTVKILNPNDQQSTLSYEELEIEINKLLQEVNRQMSTYIPNSELSLFNRYHETDWFPISRDLAIVLNQSLSVSKISRGAFDITVGPLVNLWGFGPEENESAIPDDEEIKRRMLQIGYKKIAVQLSPPSVRKDIPEIYCDLSAIAKGFAIDKIAEYLESLNFENYLVEIGGEVRAKGYNHLREPWSVGIQSPYDAADVPNVIKLRAGSVATSGDYVNYFEKDGVRYSHTINPRTGKPIAHKLASVTVLHRSCMVADAMATAINVLGPVEGYEFAVQNKLAVFMVVRAQGGFVERITPQFRASISEF